MKDIMEDKTEFQEIKFLINKYKRKFIVKF